MNNILLENIDKVHTTELGVERIRRNLNIDDIDVVAWCKEKILDNNSIIEKAGKNWYIHVDGYIITINANSYTIITSHVE